MAEASSQDGDIGRHGSPLHKTTSKLQLKYRTNITTVRYPVERKSNYGIKETTSIQTVKKDEPGERAGPTSMCGR